MQRILFALFCALMFHGGILFLRWPAPRQTIPQLPGTESITVSFDDCAVTQQQVEQVQTPPVRLPPTPQQPATPEEPLPSLAKVAPNETEPLQPAVKKIKHIRPPAKKKHIQSKQQSTQKTQSTLTRSPDKSATQHLSSSIQPAAAAPVTSQASPLYQNNPKPIYPPLARRRGWEGVVMISVLVLEDGSPQHIQLQQSSGYQLLDKAALKAVQKWHFIPAMRDGRATVGEVIVPVHFRID